MNKAESTIARDAINASIVEAEIRLSAMITNRDHLQAIIDAPDVYEPPEYECGVIALSNGEFIPDTGARNVYRAQGSVWPTERLAKIASLRIKITNYLGHIQYELCPDFVPDFDDVSQYKYSALMDSRMNRCSFSALIRCEEPSGVFFETKAQAIEAGNRVKHLVDELNDLIRGK